MLQELSQNDLLLVEGGGSVLQVAGGVLVVAGSVMGGMTGAGIPGAIVGVIGGLGMIIDGCS